MNFRDTYHDMLHDYGFCIKLCVFSQASTWTTNHITMIQSACKVDLSESFVALCDDAE